MTERYHAFFHQFLEAWLTRRSERDTLALIGEDCTGFGTGVDEVAVANQDQEGALSDRDLYARDIHDAPNRVYYDIRTLSVRALCHATGVIMATLDLRTTILSQDVAFYGLRVTFVVSDGPDGLKLRHDHVSFPTTLHRRGEAYPIRELEERMKVFERMLHERTQTLEEAYVALAAIVNTDKLTGIASRHKLDEVMEAELQRLRRYGSAFTILFLTLTSSSLSMIDTAMPKETRCCRVLRRQRDNVSAKPIHLDGGAETNFWFCCPKRLDGQPENWHNAW